MAEDLRSWLSGIGLGGHADRFVENGVDWDVLPELTEADLKELGLSLGDRKRLLKAIGGLQAVEPAPAPLEPPRSVAVDGIQPNLAAERRSITVMFVDLVGSTQMSEQLDPEDLREVLRAFHAGCAAAIDAEDGHIARYLGDGILVYFGYPHAHEDDSARAIRAGLGIVNRLQTTNQTLAAQYSVRLQTRIGIHTGLVVVGDVGAGSARDREAIVGETPNIAARLQGEAQPDTVVVSAATRRLVEGLFTFEDVGQRALKGVSALIRIFRVVGPAESIDRFDARVQRGLTPLVGRVAELDMLRQRWDQARDGEMRCVLLVGEPGIGKSRVVRAFRDGLGQQPHQAITWYCSSYHRNSAFFPVIIWLCRSLGIDPKGDAGAAKARLQAAMDGLGVEDAEISATLASLLGLPAADAGEVPEASGLMFRRKVLDALSTTLGAMAQRQTLLMVVEDAHWIDPSTLDLLRELQEQLGTAQLLLLVTARPAFKPGWSYPQLVQVNLDRLSRRERQVMVEQITGGKALPAFVLDQIVARTDGVPLFVEELTKTVLEENAWRDAGTHYELEGPFQGITIPDSLQGSLLARLDRLEPSAREIAQIGAVIGREFSQDLLRTVADFEDEKLAAGLDQLMAAEIVRPIRLPGVAGKAYGFRHALIQDAAYQSLLLARRRQHHAAIGQAIVDQFPEWAAAQPEVVAQHLTAADLVDPAIAAWQRAAESAVHRGAFTEARAHVSRGLDLIERLPANDRIRSVRAVPLLLMRGPTEMYKTETHAVATYREALDKARRNGLATEFAAAAMGFVEAQQTVGLPSQEGVALVEEALRAVGPDEAVLKCRLLGRLGRALLLIGETDRAAMVTREARTMAERLDDRRGLVDVLWNELSGPSPPSALEFDQRRQLLRQLYQVSEAESDASDFLYSFSLGAAKFLEMGDRDDFQAAVRRLAELANTVQSTTFRWHMLCLQSVEAILQGDYSLAERKAEEAVSSSPDTAAGSVTGIYGVQMFTIRREQGRLAEIAPLVKRFVSEKPEEAIWKPGLMLIASDLGFHEQARTHFEALAQSDFALPMDAKRAITLTYLAEVCAGLGDSPRAERLYELLLPYRDVAILAPPFTLCCGAGAHYLGLLATTMSDWDGAEAHFKASLAMNEQLKAWPRLADTRFEYARMLLARDRKGDSVLASELRSMAIAAAERMGMGGLLHRKARLAVSK
jgi:class 3 adenylate cyclase/tetratricopeptide (TPR) repeat protein